jgi:hypothetical protein
LLGPTSKVALSILDNLCQDKFKRNLSPEVYVAAMICYKCKVKVEGLPDLFKKAERAYEEVSELVERVLRDREHQQPEAASSTSHDSSSHDHTVGTHHMPLAASLSIPMTSYL